MLKLYFSAKFLEHLMSVAYNSPLNISSIICCCFMYFNPLTLLNKIANDIKLCEMAKQRKYKVQLSRVMDARNHAKIWQEQMKSLTLVNDIGVPLTVEHD